MRNPGTPLSRSLLLALPITLAATCAVPAEALAAFLPPQARSLARLRDASLSPVQVTYLGGFPAGVLMEVPATGATPTERARNFLTEYADFYLQNHPDVALVYSRSGVDPDDGEMVRFAQTYRGLPVFGAEIVVKVSGDAQGPQRVFRTVGRLFVPARTSSVTPIEPALDLTLQISAGQAETAARQALGVAGAALRGETRLMLYDPSLLEQAGPPRLAWRVGLTNAHAVEYLIDANDSSVLYEAQLGETATGLTDFDLLELDAQLTNMDDTACFLTAGTVIGDEGGLYPGAEIADPEAVVAWNAARATYLMFHDTLGRHSYDDDDAELLLALHAHLGFPKEPNASAGAWCGIEFSNGWVADDVLAHEFGHLVIDETSDLLGTYTPGSLNESYADTMAMLVDTADWLLGESMTDPTVSLPIRNYMTPRKLNCTQVGIPSSGPCPDRLSDIHVLPLSVDNGGVHVNAGIANKAFYLMAAGGTFNGWTVQGMGRTKMGRIAHRAFINLPSNAGWSTLRNQAVGVAQFMYVMNQGITLQDICTVRNAFAAVDIGNGDIDCDGVEELSTDTDGDGILDDGDHSGSTADARCVAGNTEGCDDNCPNDPNPDQANFDGDWMGDICDADDDQDGVPDAIDACPNWPGTTGDTDGDSIPDCIDDDDDNDLIPDDGDGSGIAGDHPCQADSSEPCDDNCRLDPNPMQYDGDGNGFGDACDPDLDGDGLYVLDDNCTFVSNPGQEDTDGDGIGDACDKCPNVPDSINAYTYPVDGEDPEPYQPDSDGDGIPDACDNLGFGSTGMLNGGQPYGAFNVVSPNGLTFNLEMDAPDGAGHRARLAFPACDTGDPHGVEANQRIEIVLGTFPPALRGWVEDGRGRVVGRFRPDAAGTSHGLRFRPRCQEDYFMFFETLDGWSGPGLFTATAAALVPTGDNPWTSNAALFSDPPPLPPDQDGDGLWDASDTCPAVPDPTNADADRDGIGDACDPTPGGPVTVDLSGVVAAFDDGGGPPDFPGIAPGVPFTGRLTYDTTMPVASGDGVTSRTYVQAPPFAPLGLSVVVGGFEFSAGPGDGFEVTVRKVGRFGGDQFEVRSHDVSGQSAATENLILSLFDSSNTAFPSLALPPSLDAADFDTRTIQIDLDSGSPDTSAHLTLAIDALAASYREPRLYWLDTVTNAIQRSGLDGSGIETLVTASDPIGFEVDPSGGRIYWTECCSGKVRRADLDGGNPQDLAAGLGFPYGIGLDPVSAKLVFADAAVPGALSTVGVGGGTPSPLIGVAPATPYAVAVDPAAGKVYWTEFGSVARIRRANLDGTGAEDLVDGTTTPLYDPRGLALDVAAGRMYWTDVDLDRIYGAGLDGAGPELLADAASAGLQDPTGIAVDPLRGKLYWADSAQHAIQRSNLDGSNVETVLTIADGLSFPRDLFVDPGTDCRPPTAAVSIDDVETMGGGDPRLTLSDPNAPDQVTGYDVYRSADASLPRSAWPLVALDVTDADPATPGVQWTDATGDVSPTGVWYYTAVAYNAGCPLEGPQ